MTSADSQTRRYVGTKKASLSCDTERGCENKVGGDLLSRGCAVPSARLGLTSLFGMGRGDPQRYNHQNIVWTTQAELANTFVKATMAAAPAATAHLIFMHRSLYQL